MVSAVTLADRAATFLAATNIEPDLVDPRFDYELLSKSVDANLELFGLVREEDPSRRRGSALLAGADVRGTC